MIRQEQVDQLLAFTGNEQPVLSLYLNLEPARQLRRSYRIVVEDLVKDLERRLEEHDRAAFEREVARVQRFLESAQPQGKGLALFSCTPRNFWQVYPLPVAVADRLSLGPLPYVQPLLDVLDEYERYVVALVDKEKARLFTVYLGEIEEERDLFDVVPGKHKQGGWSQADYQRHHEVHVHWHLKRVAEELARLLRRRPFDRLVLAGPEEATSELRRLLTRPLAMRLVGSFPAEIFASEAEVLEQTLAIERQVERETEERLVSEVVELAGNGGRATLGLSATLEAIWLGRVEKLLVAEGARSPGAECASCGRLEPGAPTACPVCHGTMVLLEDVVERAVERALDERGRVEIVHGEAATRLKQAGEGVGALLRFLG